MIKVEGKTLRSYRLGQEDGEGAADTLIALAEGLAGGDLAIKRLDDPNVPAVPIHPSLLAPIVDLVSLLICKTTANVLVLDGNDEISQRDAVKLLGCRLSKIDELVANGVLAPRRHLSRERLKLQEVLAAVEQGDRGD